MFLEKNSDASTAVSETDETSEDDLYEAALDAVNHYSSAISEALAGTKQHQARVIDAVYRLCLAVGEDREKIAEFCAKRKIKINPNTKYPIQPIVKAVIGEGDPLLRTKISIWSGAITAGLRESLDAPAFVQKVESTKGGLQGVYQSQVKAAASKSTRHEAAVRLQAAKQKHGEAFPRLKLELGQFGNPVVQGKQLLIIEQNEHGEAWSLARLLTQQDAVERMYDLHVLRWFSSKEDGHD